MCHAGQGLPTCAGLCWGQDSPCWGWIAVLVGRRAGTGLLLLLRALQRHHGWSCGLCWTVLLLSCVQPHANCDLFLNSWLELEGQSAQQLHVLGQPPAQHAPKLRYCCCWG
jgi:hypothetical protein